MPTPLPMGYTAASIALVTLSANNVTNVMSNATSSVHQPRVPRRLLAAIIIPPIFALVVLFSLLYIRRKRNTIHSQIPLDAVKVLHREQRQDETPPFLQPKAELAGKDARLEIDGCESKFELSREAKAELDSSVRDNQVDATLASWLNMQRLWKFELEGEDVAKEKE